jgi:hypothetical protein
MNGRILVGGIPKNSKSPVDVWVVRDEVDDKLLVCKIFSQSSSAFGKLLLRESFIYFKVKEDLIKKKNLPFFVRIRNFQPNITPSDLWAWAITFEDNPCILDNLVRNISFMLGEEEEERVDITSMMDCRISKKEDIQNQEALIEWQDRGVRFSAIMTEMITGRPLFNWLLSNTSRLCSEVMPALFFSIFCLAEAGICQNDLHWENVIVETKRKGKAASRVVAFMNNLYIFKMKAIPVIFDFDRAVLRNESTPLFEVTCPNFNAKRDMTKAMCIFHRLISYASAKKTLSRKNAKIIRAVDKQIFISLNSEVLADRLLNGSDCRFGLEQGGSLLCSDAELANVNCAGFVKFMLDTYCEKIEAKEAAKLFSWRDVMYSDKDREWAANLFSAK